MRYYLLFNLQACSASFYPPVSLEVKQQLKGHLLSIVRTLPEDLQFVLKNSWQRRDSYRVSSYMWDEAGCWLGTSVNSCGWSKLLRFACNSTLFIAIFMTEKQRQVGLYWSTLTNITRTLVFFCRNAFQSTLTLLIRWTTLQGIWTRNFRIIGWSRNALRTALCDTQTAKEIIILMISS